MESNKEAEAYDSAAAQAHLDRRDNTFVDHLLSLGLRSGVALDVGTGTGQIPIKLAFKLPQLKIRHRSVRSYAGQGQGCCRLSER